MTTRLLLLGAGFSRNWGGWLATELTEFLLGRPELDAYVRDLLIRHRQKGFEAPLDQLQANRMADPEHLAALEKATLAAFDKMNLAFEQVPENSGELELFKFLARFNAIFTLNQDTLLETRYHVRNVALLSGNRVSAHSIPGMTPQPKAPISGDQSAPTYFPADTFSIPPRSQPLIKLHGSSNWRSQNKDLLIIGGNKQAAIAKEPVLSQSAAVFSDYLSRPDTRLMVIGYSFGDFHINKAIEDAAA